ncbi:MAG: TatD family hydrolase [Candidatus Sumerlaeia bacterium]|nr:TatD family hydrolase [Candidatus Sumerlaeia bacterium]
MLSDSHAHVQHPHFNADRPEVLHRAAEAGVGFILNLATTFLDAPAVVALADEYPFCYAAVGTHPCDTEHWSPEAEGIFEELARHPKVLMIGEIGLDYFHKPFDKAHQHKALRSQLRLAKRLNLPVSLHCRGEGCYADLIAILQEEQAHTIGGISHCFAGTLSEACELLNMGFHLGVGGIATYPKNQDIRHILQQVGPEKLLLETDSPFLSPNPVRSKRNEPAHLVHTAEILKDLVDSSKSFPFL